ncbi:hypothetical protein [Agrobacterium rosae]
MDTEIQSSALKATTLGGAAAVKITDFSEATLTDLTARLGNVRYLILDAEAPKGKPPFDIPGHITVYDYRYGGLSVVRGNHPRIEGLWTQYGGLDTGLAKNITISDVITNKTPVENFKSEPYELQNAPFGTVDPDTYHNQHNHYQNVHIEVYNFAKDLNGVALWGDAASLTPGAKSWGAFFSARSWPVKWGGYTPEDSYAYENENFDAALVGIEIDILNGGQPWPEKSPDLPERMAKVGLQIVGFGKKNTAAIEVRTEDSDSHIKTPEDRRGPWHWGIIMRNSLSTTSTAFMVEDGLIARGIDFDKVKFFDGALRISGDGPRSGIIFDDGVGGEIYSEIANGAHTLVTKIGSGGMKILDSTGTKILFQITDQGVDFVQKPLASSRFDRIKGRIKDFFS